MKLQQVLHLYLGVKCMYSRPTSYKEETVDLPMLKFLHESNRSWDLCKPILRPLSDMTEEEAKEIDLGDVQVGLTAYAGRLQMYMTADQFAKCLKMRFDLFNLIPSGEAIDAKTIIKTKL